jgi:hypothetical protein
MTNKIIDNYIRICKALTLWLSYFALFAVHSPPFMSLFHIAIQHSSWFFYRSFHAQHQYPQQSLFLNLSLRVSDPLGLDYLCGCHFLSIPQTLTLFLSSMVSLCKIQAFTSIQFVSMSVSPLTLSTCALTASAAHWAITIKNPNLMFHPMS